MARNTVKSAKQDFSQVVHANIPRARFRMPSTLVTTMNGGELVPIYLQEVLPGDTFRMATQHVARLITPLVPIMDNIEIDLYAFNVPNRIVWDNWKALMGENEDSAWTPSSTPAGVPSWSTATAVLEKKLGDYYGLPVGMLPSNHNISDLPFRGYSAIWNDWFRNQNVQAPTTITKGDGVNSSGTDWYNSDLKKVNKFHDRFTSCLPAPQKGESQLIPIEISQLIPVITQTSGHGIVQNDALKWYSTGGTTIQTSAINLGIKTGGNTGGSAVNVATSGDYAPANLFANPSGLSLNDTTIADLRTAFQIQKLYERDARGGTRYVEMLKAHFGVDAGDYRLQRPEYLGHTKFNMNINQVEQTGETGTTPQGNVAAYGHSQGSDFLFEKSFVEHGYIHIFAVARHRKTYQQGLDPHWSRQDRFDFYFPALAHISEQPVYQKEIYALAANAQTVFGYQEAWSEYRFMPNRVTAEMRYNATNSFDIWHFADEYSSAPTLSDTWMQDNSETNIQRTLAVATGDQIKLNVRFDVIATRPIPVHSIPGLIDHF